jgi:hypothetical protein
LALADPWDSFARRIERICATQADDRGLTDLIAMTLSTAPDAWRRTPAFLLGGFRASGAAGPTPAPPTPAQLGRVLDGDASAEGFSRRDGPQADPVPDVHPVPLDVAL